MMLLNYEMVRAAISGCMLCMVCSAARALGACFFFCAMYPSINLLCNACCCNINVS